MRIIIVVATLLFSHFSLLCQTKIPDGYYLFPINPGQQNYLAGTMGELRSSHFHAGIDVKTGGVSGLPVYAAADGYVSRIKIETGGYGHALYITHPNGTSTVYAHLSKFEQGIAQYVLDQQYEQESFSINLFPAKTQFEFKRGEIIAYSGNTGSSTGPHLHFEIRDENERILDPLQFRFKEIKDDITPQINKIAFVTLNGKARVNNTFGRFEFEVIKVNNKYTTRIPISLKGNIGVELYAYDLLNGVYNRNGIQRITMVIDNDTVFSQFKNKMSFAKQRDILVHMDYDRLSEGGNKFNKLFIDDGNTNDFYIKPSRGYNFSDSIHQINIFLEDSYGNISTLETSINQRRIINNPDLNIKNFEVYRNQIHIRAPHLGSPAMVTLHIHDSKKTLTPYRVDKREAYYLWDLRNGLPDSLDINGNFVHTKFYTQIPSETEISYYNHDSDLTFYKNSLFDTLYLQFEKKYDSINDLEIFSFPHHNVPLKSNIKINLKPTQKYNTEKSRVYAYHGGKVRGFEGGNWSENQISFSTRNFGAFTIASDTIPPIINPRIINNKELYFKISDERSGIGEINATLNGKFILMYFEPKKDLIWAVPKNGNITMSGEFRLIVTDMTGNTSVYETKLK